MVFLLLVPGGVPLLPLGFPDGDSGGASRLFRNFGIESIPPHAKLGMFAGFHAFPRVGLEKKA
jgi:hypothetical protein